MTHEHDPYLPAAETRVFLGNISEMTLWRKVKKDPSFPKPIVINTRRFWRVSELANYMEAHRRPTTGEAE